MEAKKCIICDAPATSFTGHIHIGNSVDTAGWCNKHKFAQEDYERFKDIVFPDKCEYNRSGCYGIHALTPAADKKYDMEKTMTPLKCDTCIHLKTHTTGRDDYPPCTKLSHCGKGHWENSPEPDNEEQAKLDDPWGNCTDYEFKILTP